MTTLLGLDLTGRRVLVAGGGPVAARKVAGLAADGARVVVVAPQLCEPLAERHRWGQLEWHAREVEERDVDGAWLVVTATGDRATDTTVAAWADERRVFCVAGGLSGRGSARTPATFREADLLVGVVSSDTADPGRTTAVRDALALLVRSGSVDLRARRRQPGDGRVLLVGGGPGDPGLLTVAARVALARADVVVTDRLGPVAALEDLPSDVEVIDVGKTPGNHPVPQHEIGRILVEQARRGRTVVRLKGGDPFVYGRGGEEVLACREAGVPVTVVPGVSSAFAVPAAAGIPLTHRGTVGAIHVVHGHDGWTPAALAGLRDRTHTVVVLMGVGALGALAAVALAGGVDPALPVAVVESGTLDAQRVTRARLDEVAGVAARVGVRAPAVIVLGDVAAPGLLEPGGSDDGRGDR
ncbi:uroporphyrinogen-III C-methyltransferase [Cellulomonas alba]|uniref:uroporphyrinogen-III C-methyltransferase n=1 Tax=Cellulomonas alba TaxID=3053467 RepID=A0ABT7SET6_9CELL|nr:uroporphyrinogen-III C-methyltransferase [Cellulomonas alba]MDM7854087.1 uroporphyrinogen-III C-methyltransferase [Cellulomonas alba]